MALETSGDAAIEPTNGGPDRAPADPGSDTAGGDAIGNGPAGASR